MLLNTPICATLYGNTGYGDCFLEPKKIVGAIQTGSTFSLSAADVLTGATLLAKLNTARHAAIGARIFPYKNFISVDDQTEDENIQTTDYGGKYITREGDYDWKFRFLKGGVQALNEFQKNNGAGKYFYFFDDANVLYGYRSAGLLKPFPVDQFKALKWKLPSGSDEAGYYLRFIMNQQYMNNGNLGFVKSEFNLNDIEGLQTVVLSQKALTSNVVSVYAKTLISGLDLNAVYGATLAAGGAWVLTNLQTGAVIPIVTVTNGAGFYDVTIPTANWTAALTGDKFSLSLAAPSVLSVTPYFVSGFESQDALIITKP